MFQAEAKKHFKRRDVQFSLIAAVVLPFIVTYLTKLKIGIVSSLPKTPFHNTFLIAFLLGTMIFPLLAIVNSANTLSKEIESKVLWVVLGKPVRRTRLLYSKFFSLFLVCSLVTFLVLISSFLSGAIFYGAAPFNKIFSKEQGVGILLWQDILLTYVCAFLGLLFCSSLALFFSIFSSTSTTIMSSLFLLIVFQVLETKKGIRFFLPTFLYQFASIVETSKDPLRDGLKAIMIISFYIIFLWVITGLLFKEKEFLG